MHFGPSAAAADEAIYEKMKEAQGTGGWRGAFNGGSSQGEGHFGGGVGARASTSSAAHKEARWRRYGVAFADRGPMERDYYRQRAQAHRAGVAARRAWWPLQLALFAGVGAAIWKGMDALDPRIVEKRSGGK